MASSWPLAGRERELERIRATIDGNDPFAMVLVGAAGVGKTRLAQEIAAMAEASGVPATWASATGSASSIPFGALAHLLPAELPRGAGPQNLLRVIADALTGEGSAH